MNTLTNAGYDTRSESQGKVSIGLPYTMSKSGTFIMPNKIEYQKGDVINGLTYIREVSRKRKNIRRVLFRCHCGKEFECGVNFVRYGNTSSCGCSRIKHGLTGTKWWHLYNDMMGRCHNLNHASYDSYGARGISVYENWRGNIEEFIKHIRSLPDCGKKGYSLDREDNDGNYEPGNLKWSTKHAQSANRTFLKRNKTGIIGVHFNKARRKYYSAIMVNGKAYNLGQYKSKYEALMARNNFIINNELWEYPIQKM